jgi:Rap1a immunity proteins
MNRLARLSLAFALLAQSSHAQAPNAAAILKSCSTSGDQLCSSYLNGVIAGVLVDQVSREQGSPICLPARVTTEEVRVKVTAFLAEHPNIWTLDGNSAVGVALQMAYPCGQSH